MTHSDGCVLKWFESQEHPILKQIKVSKGLKEDFDFFFKLLTVLGHIYPPSKYIYAMYTTSIVPLEAEKMHILIVCCPALKEEIYVGLGVEHRITGESSLKKREKKHSRVGQFSIMNNS